MESQEEKGEVGTDVFTTEQQRGKLLKRGWGRGYGC
jgi:hypothetical protein